MEPIVRVVWKDAHGVAGTTALAIHEIPHGGIKITSYGLLLRRDEAGVSIASEVCEDGTYRGYTFIPAGMLLDVEPLIKPHKPRQPRKKVIVDNKESEDGKL